MKKHTLRTVLILVLLAVAAVYMVPTVGWMTLSPEQRQARLDKWNEEDRAPGRLGYWEGVGRGIRRWAEFDRDKVINLGLDLQGGIHMVVGFDMEDVPTEMKEAGFRATDVQQMVLQRIWRRVNDFEAKEPIIQTLGDSQVQIQLPGEKNMERARRLIMQTAFMTFNLVSGPDETRQALSRVETAAQEKGADFLRFIVAPPVGSAADWRVPRANYGYVRDVVEQAKAAGLVPQGKTFAFSPAPNPGEPAENQYYSLYLMNAEPEMTGEGLRLAVPRPDQENPQYWQVLFELGSQAATRFADVTEANIERRLAIVVDGVVVSAPTIQSRIFGSGTITGTFTSDQAQDLAIALNSGSMPVPVREEYSGIVGASLGRDSIRYGVNSAIGGFLCVIFFMLIYYRLAGVVSVVALLANAILVLGAFAYFRLTMTLPGIAGLVLTLGMAVDANVLIFERIREELRNGRTLAAALDSGYSRATVTILDANITTLIAALILMQFGTGPVEGFAIALSVGVCTSVFTGILVSRALFDALLGRVKAKTLTMMSVFKPETHIPFLNFRKFAFAVSAIAIVVTMGLFFARGYENNFGVDFTTGTSMIVKVDAPQVISVGDVRDRLFQGGFAGPVVQVYQSPSDDSPNQFAVRVGEMRTAETGTAATSSDVEQAVLQALADLTGTPAQPEQSIEFTNIMTVGPAVGKELRTDAYWAISYAVLMMMLYLWFRFELKFAVGAAVALVHDVLFTVGLLSLFRFQIDMTVIAALLTIVGYSLNDTIVIYDRIREDLQVYRGKGQSLAEIMDLSINQTLSRTLLTSLTTLMVVFILFLFGGTVIRPFAFALLAGIVVGTYSSIYIASPVVLAIQQYFGQRNLPMGSGTGGEAPRRYRAKKEASA